MPSDKHTFRIAAVFSDVFRHPAKGLRHITGERAHVHLGQQAVVGRHKHEALVHEPLRLERHILFVTCLPAATMDPKHDRQAFGVRR